MERVTAAIMAGALRYSAADVYDACATLNELTGRARVEMAKADFLLVPTAVHHYTVAGKHAPCWTAANLSQSEANLLTCHVIHATAYNREHKMTTGC